jgi:hypothetical protein
MNTILKTAKNLALEILIGGLVIISISIVNGLIKHFTGWDSDYVLGVITGFVLSFVKIRQ